MPQKPTSQVWNTSDKSFPRQITQNFNNVSISLATKESGYYTSLASPAGIKMFPEENGGKPGTRKCFKVTALPDFAPTTTTTIAHGESPTQAVFLRGMAYNSTTGVSLPIPYASSTAADIIEMYSDGTNIYIIVGKDMSAYSAEVYFDFITL